MFLLFSYVLLLMAFSFLIVFGWHVPNTEDYFRRIVDKVSLALFIMCGLKCCPLLVLLIFSFLNAGSSATFVSIKAFLSISMIVGNFIDVYLFGMIAVFMNWTCYYWCFGLVLHSFPFYVFLTRLELFLLILSLLELFPSFSQSLTLANRLSIITPNVFISAAGILTLSIESTKGIYSISIAGLSAAGLWTTNIISNDFLTSNQLNKFCKCINSGDIIAVSG